MKVRVRVRVRVRKPSPHTCTTWELASDSPSGTGGFSGSST